MKKIFMNAGSAEGASSVGLLFMRIMVGGMMLYSHGWPKLMGFTAKANAFPDPLGVGSTASLSLTIFAEVVCSALVVVGFTTRWAAAILCVTMVVAAFVIHGSDPFAKKELALLYAAPLLSLIFTGGGRVSIDAALNR